MKFKHKNLAKGRWYKLSFVEQMANIGSEVERAILWNKKGDKDYMLRAVERALELLYLTIEDKKNKLHLKELARLREFLIDYFYFGNEYNSSEKFWHKYFYPFYYIVGKSKDIRGKNLT
jgi:hypothetical protein